MLVLRYSSRSLVARRARTLLTVSVIALVVLATTLMMSLVTSLKGALSATGNPDNLVVLRKGATSDASSSISLEAVQAIRFFDGIARAADGSPLVSPELVEQPLFDTRNHRRETVLVRGVDPRVALAVHDEVRVLEGRMFEPSSGEAVVGRKVAERYADTALGDTLEFGRGRWTVVGLFEASGTTFEGEVWVDAGELARDARRSIPYNGVRLRAEPGADLEELQQRIDADPRFALDARTELEYNRDQASSADAFYFLVIGLALLAGVGAAFGVMNTLFAAVQARRHDIAILRTLGFSRFSIYLAFLAESLLLALLGFLAGAAAASLAAETITAVAGGVSFPLRTFTTSTIDLHVGGVDLLFALAFSAAVGVAGGALPAWRATRIRPVEVLRTV